LAGGRDTDERGWGGGATTEPQLYPCPSASIRGSFPLIIEFFLIAAIASPESAGYHAFSPMGISIRLLFLAAFSYVWIILYTDAKAEAHKENPDNSRVVLLFAGTILDGLAVGLVLTLLVVPSIGDRVGGFFYNPGTEIEHDPHADAIARLAQGNPEGAIDVYEEILNKDPSDTLAISEIARICHRDLGDTPRAATFLERALDQEWPHEQSSFLANRLADVYLLQGDRLRARELLVQIATTLQGTKYAANALHRIHEIERAIDVGASAAGLMEGGEEAPITAEVAPPPEDEAPSI